MLRFRKSLKGLLRRERGEEGGEVDRGEEGKEQGRAYYSLSGFMGLELVTFRSERRYTPITFCFGGLV